MKATMETKDFASRDLPDDDPHASKISPDDPRLRIARPPSRVLKMKPIIAVAAALVGVGAFTILSSARRSDQRVAVAREPGKVSDRPPGVPAFLQEVPSSPMTSVNPDDDESALQARAAPARTFADITPPARPDPRLQHALESAAQLEDEARSSSLFFASASRATSSTSPSAPAVQPPPLPAAATPGTSLAGSKDSQMWDPNLQLRKNAYLEEPQANPDYLPTTLQSALSPYELKATAIIPATLITGINSDLPGPIIAQVREPVYDTVSGQHLLIPQGARLLASYDSMIAWGQERVLLCWQRIIFPNGSSINLGCMPAADLKGQAGLTDEVNEHWDRLLAAVGLSTVLSLGVQGAAGNTTGYQPTLAQSAARNAAQEVNSIGQGMVQRQLNIQPTITVRPGFGVNVIVTKDMILQPYVD